MRVFVLDESAVIRERLKAILSRLPEMEVIGEAGDPIEGIHFIRQLKPDAVILDFRSHRRSGIDIARNIKKITPSPIVVMLTNRLCPTSRKECMDNEVDFFFDKFTELDKLIVISRPSSQYLHNESVVTSANA